MNTAKIIDLLVKGNAKSALWLLAVGKGLKEECSCTFNPDKDYWSIQIKATTFERMQQLLERCRDDVGMEV